MRERQAGARCCLVMPFYGAVTKRTSTVADGPDLSLALAKAKTPTELAAPEFVRVL